MLETSNLFKCYQVLHTLNKKYYVFQHKAAQEKFSIPGIVEIEDSPSVRTEEAKAEGFYISTPRFKFEQKGELYFML